LARCLLVVSLTLVVACDYATQPASRGTPPPSPPATPVQPPVQRGRAIALYEGAESLYAALAGYHGGTPASRYIFYESGAFVLQFTSARFGQFEYDGEYFRGDTLVTLRFSGWSVAGPWLADATLKGDTLSVRYNLIMAMSDFAAGRYYQVR
jgi:hypothetical protein